MSTKLDLGKIFFLILFLTLSVMTVMAGTIKGSITDKQTREPLTGATVQIVGTTQGAIADMDGNYSLNVTNGIYTLSIKYIGYKDIVVNNVKSGKADVVLNFELESDAQTLGEVSVVARKNLEGERALQMERRKATLAIENIGSKEMSIKGISNVEEGVKKITGISIADAGQLIVRGLGDRYSTTTLNGLPIASPNPDNKLIPLDLFPSSTIQNITVSNVYNAEAFADYSGAHIDISTKENIAEDFFSISFNTGGKFNTLGKDRYQMNRNGSLFKTSGVDQAALDMPLSDFDNYVKTGNIFDTSFAVKKKSTLPDFNGNLGFGKNISIDSQTLSILASVSAGNGYQNMDNAFYKTLEATGNVQDNFSYDSYAQELKLAALGYIGYTLRRHDRIGYTFFYTRNATDTYQRREGTDAEDHELTGSNNITHIYTLQNHQLNGLHNFGEQDRWELTWGGSYSKTGSEEPDRRQVMYIKNDDGTLGLFKLNRQETMRYFGKLDEDEWVGDVQAQYRFSDENKLRFGAALRDKTRDFTCTSFYYNLKEMESLNVTDIYHTDGYLNFENVQNGSITINRSHQKRNEYSAGSRIWAGFIEADYYPVKALLVNLGVRMESTRQWVKYYNDGGMEMRRDLNTDEFFPALNLKYTFDKKNSLRLAASRTVTRPSFVEMAPFLYQESYGGTQVRGNENLDNGYNYNIDLRYEFFRPSSTDMVAVTAYYKYLDSPIERTQTTSGGAMMHSFQNASDGLVAGVEVEARKEIVKDLKAGINASYMYTNVNLPEGGVYTNAERPLQGASPYLMNADLTYSPKFGKESQLTVALLYNLQGERIQAVGIQGIGDVKQLTLHTLDFNANVKFNAHWSVKFSAKNLLNTDVVFRQEIPSKNTEVEVERFNEGVGLSFGVTYTL